VAQLSKPQVLLLYRVNSTMQRSVLKLYKMKHMWGAFACRSVDQESVSPFLHALAIARASSCCFATIALRLPRAQTCQKRLNHARKPMFVCFCFRHS
jgi:hypothetical protein